MGFMGDYYGGPSPLAAGVSQFTSNFMDAYTKMKGLGFQEERLAEEKRRTGLQEQELMEQSRARQQQEEFQKQRLQNEQVGLEHQKLVTEELRKTADRRKAQQEILAQSAKSGMFSEEGEPIQLADQIARMESLAQQLNAADPGAGLPYQESAMRMRAYQSDITKSEMARQVQMAQINEMMAQTEREKAKQTLQEEERKGVVDYIGKNKAAFKAAIGQEFTGKEPLQLLLHAMDLMGKKAMGETTDKLKQQQLRDIDSEIRHLETTIKGYTTFQPKIDVTMDAATRKKIDAQQAAVADELERLKARLERAHIEREFILTGKLPPKVAPTETVRPRMPLNAFTMGELPPEMPEAEVPPSGISYRRQGLMGGRPRPGGFAESFFGAR